MAGLALLGPFSASIAGALADPGERDAAAVTFVVTASGLTIMGVSAAFWGLLAGAAVLMTLDRPRRLTHGELADACYIRPATLTGVVDTLVKSGHVERKADAVDRRAVWVELTGKGSEVAGQVLTRVRGGKPPRRGRPPVTPLTSVDADPEKEAVVRAFLIEFIVRLSEQQEGPWEQK